MAPRAGGRSSRLADKGGGGSFMIRDISVPSGPENGGWPASSSYRMTPSE
jgi:hypothetical protein